MDGNLDTELARTEPDVIVYRPRCGRRGDDTGNEHFLVFDGPDGDLMALWTQSSGEGAPNQRIVLATSDKTGRDWSEPQLVAGPNDGHSPHIASWGFPIVSRNGRIYAIYSRHTGKFDAAPHHAGVMEGRFSDDAGQTWSPPRTIPTPRSTHDNPDSTYPPNWIVWQKPERLSDGKYFVGVTHWVSPAVRHPNPIDSWIADEAVTEFMRFDNIDDDPDPADIAISHFARDDDALRVGFPGHPELSVCQEPSIVMLHDGRLFTVLRTSAGSPCYSVSNDQGRTWSTPAVLRYRDGGEPLRHPLSPCPIYRIEDGRYVLFYHNHDGHFGGYGPTDNLYHRRPICLTLGEFRPDARQPVWFSPPKVFMDNDGVPLGYLDERLQEKPGQGRRADLALYSSFTIRNGRRTLWYPDRKFFLLGKHITDGFLADMTVPG